MLNTEYILNTVCSVEGLTLETSAKHHISQETKHTISTLLIKPIFSVLAHAEKQFFFKISLRVLIQKLPG